VFVLLWSTGFVVARYATDDSGPLTFLAIRMFIATAVLWLLATVTKAPAITAHTARWVALSGLGMHAMYLGGVFLAISWGMPAGISALIAGLHPVLTTVSARFLLGERLRPLQWLGVALGFSGVGFVVVDRLSHHSVGLSGGALAAAAVSVLGMVMGTLLQRRHGVTMPLVRGTTVQYASSAVVLCIGAVLHEDFRFEVTTKSVIAMSWAVGVMSMASVLIMLWLLQQQAAAKVSSLFFLTPALSALEGAILFGERFSGLEMAGLVVALVGVALTLRA
jgi:drug/metabolite transporter (DMT)-like permease